MYAGVGTLDSPKYSLRTPSIRMAAFAISRMRDCGTCAAEAASVGMVVCHPPQYLVDLLEQRGQTLMALSMAPLCASRRSPDAERTNAREQSLPLARGVRRNAASQGASLDATRHQITALCRRM